jgi:hypothetical protein
VATPSRAGGGGPPWMRNNASTSSGSTSTTQGQGQAQGGRASQTSTAQASGWQILDWRILLLITAALSVAFTLIFMGYAALKASRSH